MNSLLSKQEDKRHVLYSSNEYKLPRLFSESTFDQDIEAENFFLIENTASLKNHDGLVLVQPNKKTKLLGFPEKKKVIRNDDYLGEFLNRLLNSFIFTESMLYYHKYSQIVYEGESLNLFGIAKLNTFTNCWEITKPIAFLKEGMKDMFIK